MVLMLKTLGLLSWAGCLLTLAYQGISWLLFNAWPSLDLLSILETIFGLDLLQIIKTLPLDIVAKVFYLCATTELSLFLWWAGVGSFGMAFTFQMVRR